MLISIDRGNVRAILPKDNVDFLDIIKRKWKKEDEGQQKKATSSDTEDEAGPSRKI
ncbi:hypothetical protein BGZ49_005337, partial [Haplosporangium sp. Z 27]